MVKSEKERINNNARKWAKRIAIKTKMTTICEECNSEEELILCFKDTNIQNADLKNLYYLCKPCNEVRKFPDGRKREDYTRCDMCKKFRLCAPNLFDEQKICETCFHSYSKEHKIDDHRVLFPVKFTPNGFPETFSRIWFYGRPKFDFKKKEPSDEEKKLGEEFRKESQKKVILEVANHLHDNVPIEEIKKMYEQVKDEETQKMFLAQLLPEDRNKLLNQN
ncbi:MAG: hypothetical protein COA77_10590 [Thaumarchaeota archaeon]|nr:MAG: hypothetical protein COA77_10590 [Nitrososphaerota archaeon]